MNETQAKLYELAANKPGMNPHQFIEETDLKIEDMYVDKFWNSIENDAQIIVDDELIRWLGYSGKIDNCRTNFKITLKRFNISYIIKKYQEIVLLASARSIKMETTELKHLKKIDFILMQPDQFREICMAVHTDKGKEIRQYYISLERIFKQYIQYINFQTQQQLAQKQTLIDVQQQELNTKNDKIQQLQNTVDYCQKDLINVKKLKNKKEYIYIITTKTYAQQGLWKIGKTKNLSARTATMNSSHATNDKMVVIKKIAVFDSKSAEDRIKVVCQNLRDSSDREFYRGQYFLLEKIIQLICENLNHECEEINQIVEKLILLNQFDKGIDLTYGMDIGVFDKKTATLTINQNGNKKTATFDLNSLSNDAIMDGIKKALNSYSEAELKQTYNYDADKDNVSLHVNWVSFKKYLMDSFHLKANTFKPLDWRTPVKSFTNNDKHIKIVWKTTDNKINKINKK